MLNTQTITHRQREEEEEMPAAPPNDCGQVHGQPPPAMLPFPLARTWGGGGAGPAPKPVQHVLLAEFDINEGWSVVLCALVALCDK